MKLLFESRYLTIALHCTSLSPLSPPRTYPSLPFFFCIWVAKIVSNRVQTAFLAFYPQGKIDNGLITKKKFEEKRIEPNKCLDFLDLESWWPFYWNIQTGILGNIQIYSDFSLVLYSSFLTSCLWKLTI